MPVDGGDERISRPVGPGGAVDRLLNVGCGAVFHPDWVNLDAAPVDPSVIACDIRNGIPCEDGSFDAVYASHVLEHLDPACGARLLQDCRRVLRPAGIVRIVVPDLEAIARLYIASLEDAVAGDERARPRYDWLMLELLDQAVRTSSGGEMGAYLRRAMRGEERDFIVSRVGEALLDTQPSRAGMLRRLRSVVRRSRAAAAGWAAFLFLGPEGRKALREGLFRRSGEVHRWMYDRYSLRRALESAGFEDVRICAAEQSAIAGFPRYGLETRSGKARKPDSLYAEGKKPAVVASAA